MLEQIRAQLRAILTERAERQAELDAVLEGAEARGDGTLTDDEQTAFRAAADAIGTLDEQRTALEERVAELEATADARAAAEAVEARLGLIPAAGTPATPVVVRSEERIYSAGSARRGVSFVADVVAARVDADPDAQARLAQHRREDDVDGVEARAIGTGAFAGLTVPQYLTEMVAPVARAMRPFADICNSHQLPASGMTVNISRITTGTSAAIQASENATVSETNLDDTLLTVDVRTIAGQQTLSRQALDRSEGADEIVVSDLVRAYHTQLDSQILTGAGSSGTHLGVMSVSGNVGVTYTDASPTAAELWPKLFDLVQQIQAGVFEGVSHFIMHPRRFWWIASNVGTSFPFVQLSGIQTQGGSVDSTAYGAGASGVLAGIPVIVDANVPTNLGAGTNEDAVIGVVASECHLWEEAGPLQVRVDVPSSLGVTLSVFGFSAFTAGRYPLATGDITGTGLVTPTF